MPALSESLGLGLTDGFIFILMEAVIVSDKGPTIVALGVDLFSYDLKLVGSVFGWVVGVVGSLSLPPPRNPYQPPPTNQSSAHHNILR